MRTPWRRDFKGRRVDQAQVDEVIEDRLWQEVKDEDVDEDHNEVDRIISTGIDNPRVDQTAMQAGQVRAAAS